jgi:hypothetical protein
MKKEKLLASLRRVIKAADEIMSQMPEDQSYSGTMVSQDGGSSKVIIKKADFSNGRINSLVLQACPDGNCPPSEFEGRCCTFDPTLGWNCQDGVMAGECASQGGVFEAGVSCADKPGCGTGVDVGLLDMNNQQTSAPTMMTDMMTEM